MPSYPPSFLAAIAGGALAVATVGGWATPGRADTFDVTYEPPGIESANETNLCAALGPGICTIGVETFNEQPVNEAGTSFTTDFGIPGDVITGTYTNVQIYPATEFGGAGGIGNFADTHSVAGYTLALSTTLTTGINYFGFWLSALDAGNLLAFYEDGTEVYQFTPADLLALIGNCPNPYCGNPSGPFAGDDASQPYVFLNFFDKTGPFNEIVFSENPEVGGYESDNHTVGFVTGKSGTSINAPEPGSLAMLASGLFVLMLVRRRLA
jgi:PEP-CTERM motif